MFNFPITHGRMIQTTNPIQRINREIRGKTRVICIFPNAEAHLQVVTARLKDISEEWVFER